MVHVSGKSVAVEVVTHVPVESVLKVVPVDVLVVITGVVGMGSMSSHRVLGGTVIHPFPREAFLRLLW